MKSLISICIVLSSLNSYAGIFTGDPDGFKTYLSNFETYEAHQKNIENMPPRVSKDGKVYRNYSPSFLSVDGTEEAARNSYNTISQRTKRKKVGPRTVTTNVVSFKIYSHATYGFAPIIKDKTFFSVKECNSEKLVLHLLLDESGAYMSQADAYTNPIVRWSPKVELPKSCNFNLDEAKTIIINGKEIPVLN